MKVAQYYKMLISQTRFIKLPILPQKDPTTCLQMTFFRAKTILPNITSFWDIHQEELQIMKKN